MRFETLTIKRGLLFFWALWFTIVLSTNITDGLKALKILPPRWAFASGNYALLARTTAIYSTPEWIVVALFFGLVVWQSVATILFWQSFRLFRGISSPRLAAVHAAFAVSLALWATFVIADELFIAYNLEGFHMAIVSSQLVTLLAIQLLPDRSSDSNKAN
jgi:hypothetical protein